jgi:hypothetical protein
VSEWSIELVLKTSRGDELLEGSNPSPTAIKNKNMEDTILRWKAREFVHYQKGFGWYITLNILSVLLISYFVILRDYIPALAFLLIGIIFNMYARIHPREIEVEITDKSIIVDDTEIPYLSIKRFWIVHTEETKALHFERNAYINRFATILLEDQDPFAVAEVLRNYVVETEPNVEHVSRKIARKLRF